MAALLLPGGLTAHSTFKIPFGDSLVEGSKCNVETESERAQVLRRADNKLGNKSKIVVVLSSTRHKTHASDTSICLLSK